MWIRWRAEQDVMKQEVHIELWMEISRSSMNGG